MIDNLYKEIESMKSNVYSKLLKLIIIGTTLIGLGCVVYVIPMIMESFGDCYPEFTYWIIPWKILIYVCAIPCFAAMLLCWKIAANIQKDQSFCYENAKYFRYLSYLALGDSVVFGTGSVVLWLCGMNHPGLLIVELLVVFVGLAVFVCTSALSNLVSQAADLKEDSDLTI